MRGHAIASLLVCCGCRQIFGLEDPTVATDASVGDGPAIIDAPPGVFSPAHLAPSNATPGSASLQFDADVTIDTDAMALGIAVPSGVTFELVPQASGPDVAVLRVSSLTIKPTAAVTVRGVRALIVIASTDVVIDGDLDASAVGQTAGAGGSSPGAGSVHGGNGSHRAPYLDTGGGGAGGGTAGAPTGSSSFLNNNTSCSGQNLNDTIAASAGGNALTDLDVTSLVGGSGGGSGGSSCAATLGGAGGGAIQLSTPTAISVKGRILAGGGGGARGGFCTGLDGNSGGGGGAGGSIYLQALSITVQGTLAANGGGGGGGGSGGTNGGAGGDARPNTMPAAAGNGVGMYGGHGGTGGTRNQAPMASPAAPDCGNSGGGGGAVGRIIVRAASYVSSGTETPAVRRLAP